ncbi:TPA: hypothetical protein ACH3X2_003363 [Trebouxia sp. C0005]|nr:MAG: calcium calmodulin dependent kinase kinase 2 [Trebouxia sp. A1-2]
MHAETYDASGAESPFVPTEPVLTTPVPGAVDLARSLAIDLARQRVLTETASSKNHQQRLDQAFSAIKAFEHAHSFTPIHDIKGSSNELDKISVAANIRRNSSLQSLGDHNNIALHGSPTASFTAGRDGRSSRLSNLRGGNTGRLLAPQGVTSQNIAVADFPSGHELDAANGTVSEDAAIEVTRKLVVDSLKGITFVNQYIIVGTLGQGAFGKVKLVLNSADMNLYAVKLLSKGSLMRHQRMRPRTASDFQVEAQRRMNVIRLLHHPNIICPFEVIDDPQADKLLLVMEYAEAGPVMRGDRSTEKVPLAEGVALKFFRDVLQGLDYLHSKSIVHGDLKPDNMLLASDGRVKISDFGSARMVDHGHTTVRTMGTPAFLAPEMCEGAPYHGEVADIWALGICLYMFIYGTVPFKHPSIMGLYNVIRTQPISFPSKPVVSAPLKDLISQMLCKDPARRATLPQVMTHPWTTHGNNLPLHCRQMGPSDECTLGTAKRPLGDCLEGLVQMLSPLFVQRTYKAGAFLVKQGDPADSVFFIEDGDCQVGYNQRRTADEDLISAGSNESSDDEDGPSHQSPYSDGDTDPGITDPGVTEAGMSDIVYPDEDSAHQHANDPMGSMGSTAFWDPPDLQHPANSNKVLDTCMSDVGTGSSTDPSQGGSSASANTVFAKASPGTKRIARVRKRHLGMLQTMLEASRRAAEFVTSVSKSRSIIALRGPGQFIGEVLLFDNTGRDSPMGSWQTCVRARTQVRALILTVKDLKDLVTRKPAAEVELRAAMAQRKSELLRLQTLERIAGFQQDLEGQLHILLTNPELTSVQQQSS